MSFITSVTQKGQVTLPKKYRDQAGILTRSSVRIEFAQDHIKIFPTVDFLSLKGVFPPKSGKTALKARNSLEEEYDV